MDSGSDSGSEPGHTGPYSPAPTPPSLEEVARQFPQLEIIDLLGQGGMGIVYKARQPRLDRFVALKILPAEASCDPAFAERFAREARALAKLTHPTIVAVYDFGESDGRFYLLMEFVDGVNLRQLLRERRLKPEEALQVVPQICAALQYAHDQGVIHRDIKPENILLDKKGQVKIADFGLAKLIGRNASDSALTGSQQVMGTPHYMAPEQMEKPLAVDHRADIYSLGVVFYEMLTGELPLGRFAPPSQKVHVDVRLDEVVLRTLEKEPDRRYQHASDVKSDVEAIGEAPPRRSVLSRSVPLTPAAGLVGAELEAVRDRIAMLAFGLMVAGVLACLPLLSFAAFMRFSVGEFGPDRLVPLFAILAIPIFSIIGAVKMLRLRSYRWAVTAAILALFPIPAGPFWLVGLPIGIWSLIVLSKTQVKAAFQHNRPQQLAGHDNPALGKASLWLSIVGSVLPLCLAILVTVFIENKDNKQTSAFMLCGVVLAILELAAFGCGIAAGRTAAGKAGSIIAAIVLLLLAGLEIGPGPFWLVGVPIVIWVLVVVARTPVQAALPPTPPQQLAGNGNPWLGKASLWLAIGGIVLPVCLSILATIFIENKDNKQAPAFALCGVLLVILELAAFGCGIAGWRTGAGKAGLIIAGILLLLFTYMLWEHFRPRHAIQSADNLGPPAPHLADDQAAHSESSAAAPGLLYRPIAAFDASQSASPVGERPPPPTHVAFSADGKSLIALVGMHKHVWQLDPRQDLGRRRLGDFILNATAGAIATDGKTITLVRAGGDLELWEIDTGVRRALIKNANGSVAVFSPDGKSAAVAAWDGSVSVIDAKTGMGTFSVWAAPRPPRAIRALAFLPDGNRIVLGRADGSVEFFRAKHDLTDLGGREGKYFRHDAAVTCVALEPSARKVAAGFADGVLLVWDVTTRNEVARFGPHPGMSSVAFSPDGTLIISGSTDGSVKLWGLKTAPK
jgi:predicted Ser/Thr protein kinase